MQQARNYRALGDAFQDGSLARGQFAERQCIAAGCVAAGGSGEKAAYLVDQLATRPAHPQWHVVVGVELDEAAVGMRLASNRPSSIATTASTLGMHHQNRARDFYGRSLSRRRSYLSAVAGLRYPRTSRRAAVRTRAQMFQSSSRLEFSRPYLQKSVVLCAQPRRVSSSNTRAFSISPAVPCAAVDPARRCHTGRDDSPAPDGGLTY